MSNPRMICIFVPLSDSLAAKALRTRFHESSRADALTAALSRIECLHFASVALIPPLPGVPDGRPSAMLELTIDAGISSEQLIGTLIKEAALDLKILLGIGSKEELTNLLRTGFHATDGGFVGVRDCTRVDIVRDVQSFLDAREIFRRQPAGSRIGNTAVAPPPPVGWKPKPPSIWLQSWMNLPLRACAIALLLLAGPIRAIGFGWSGFVAACMVSGLIACLTLLACFVLYPPLMMAALGLLATSEALLLSVLSFWPYQGIVLIAAGTFTIGPLLLGVFAIASIFMLRTFGFLSTGASFAGASTAIGVVLGTNIRSAWRRVSTLIAEGLPDLIDMLLPAFRPGQSVAAIGAFLLLLCSGAFVLAIGIVSLLPIIALTGIGLLAAFAIGRSPSLALALAAAVVTLFLAAFGYQFIPGLSKPDHHLPTTIVLTDSVVRIALAAAFALGALAAVGATIVAVIRLSVRSRMLFIKALILLAVFVLAWLVLPRATPLPASAHTAPTLALYASALLFPITAFLLLATTAYRQWDIDSIATLAGSVILALLVIDFVSFGVDRSSNDVLLRLAFCVGAMSAVVWIFRVNSPTLSVSKRAGCAMLTFLIISAAGASVLSSLRIDDAIATVRSNALAIAVLAFVILAIDFSAPPKRIAGIMAGLGLILLSGWVATPPLQSPNGMLMYGSIVHIILLSSLGMLLAFLILSDALRKAAFGPATTQDLAALVAGMGVLLLSVLVLAATEPHSSAWLSSRIIGFDIGLRLIEIVPGFPSILHGALLTLLAFAMLYATGVCSASFGALALIVTSLASSVILALGIAGNTFVAVTRRLSSGQSTSLEATATRLLDSSPLLTWLGEHANDFSGLVVIIALPFSALIILYAGYQLALPSWRQLSMANEPQLGDVPRTKQLHRSIAACEARLANRLQHMISVTEIRKPTWLFAPLLRYVLWVINLIGHIWCTEGKLGEAPGIHFGHWHVIDDGRRLIFCSNFEVPFGGYLDDFIRGTPDGVNAIWQCTELLLRKPACPGQPEVDYPRAFPPTWLGFLGGCRNEQWFKAYARDSMVPHLYRFEAYNLTQLDIKRAMTYLELRHDPLSGAMKDGKEAKPVANDRILRALES